MTKRSHHQCSKCQCGLTLKDVLQFISSLVLPLMLGVFTIIITIEQQRIATEQRLQDLNSSAQQRAEDRQTAMEQRAQDKQIAKEQREQDERRRLQDLQIAEDKRKQDDQLAEKQRTMMEKQRAHELNVEETRYQKEHQKYLDALLLGYMKEIGALYLENEGSLTSNPTVATLVRSKTLAVARQLDSSRNTQIIQFLFEAGQLTNGENPLDLSGAYFDGIDLSSATEHLPMHRLSLYGAHLNHASFCGLDLSYANFSKAHLKNSSFVKTYISHVDFSYAILFGANLEKAAIYHSLFHGTNMMHTRLAFTSIYRSIFTANSMWNISIGTGSTFYQCTFTNIQDLMKVNLSYISFSSSQFIDIDLRGSLFIGSNIHGVKFINTNLNGTDFSYSSCDHAQFINLQIDGVSFAHAALRETIWYKCSLTNIDFTSTVLDEATFIYSTNLQKLRFVDAKAQQINFTRAMLMHSNFSRCQCNKALFTHTELRNVSFANAQLKQANFSNSWADFHVTFQDIDASGSDFTQSSAFKCSFIRSKLINVSFTWAFLEYANFTDADVSGVDFSHAALYGAKITQKQLDSAMSLSATSVQGKTYRNPNLLAASGAGCNHSNISNISKVWGIKPREATVTMVLNQSDNTCSFIASRPLIMSQRIDVTRYRRFIDKGRARGYIIADTWNSSTTIYITTWTRLEITQNHSFYPSSKSGLRLLQPLVVLPYETTHLNVFIIFENATSQCGPIDFSIQDVNQRPFERV